MKEIKFSADKLLDVPERGTPIVWGGNASGGDEVYSQKFLSKVLEAAGKGHDTFAYLEGPCGDTDGADPTNEKERCAKTHRSFNQLHGGSVADTPLERWKPFTFKQLKDSGRHKINHCEIDNLNNNVKVPMIPLLQEIKALYTSKQMHCKLVLKNIKAEELAQIKAAFPTPKDAEFISPFHIFESKSADGGLQSTLTKAMTDLKGPGAVTIMSVGSEGTKNYGSKFSNDRPYTCEGGEDGAPSNSIAAEPPATS